jgi:hypothetical protein
MTLNLISFALSLWPVQEYVLDIEWRDGQPFTVWLHDDTPEAPLWSLFDQLDVWNIGYGFIVETTNG